PAWQARAAPAPPTSPRRTMPTCSPMKGDPGDILGLPRALRLLARRQEATERPTQVPRVVLRWSGSGEATGALRGDLDARWVRAVDGELPEPARAAQPRAPEAHEVLRGELLRRRARLRR